MDLETAGHQTGSILVTVQTGNIQRRMRQGDVLQIK